MERSRRVQINSKVVPLRILVAGEGLDGLCDDVGATYPHLEAAFFTATLEEPKVYAILSSSGGGCGQLGYLSQVVGCFGIYVVPWLRQSRSR